MLGSVAIGILAAFVIQAVRWLQGRAGSIPLGVPVWVLIGTALAIGLHFFVRRKRELPEDYHGLSDMVIHIHQSTSPDAPLRWLARAVVSGFLAVFSGCVGVEGAGMETAYGAFLRFRPRSARWFEQRRRTDASNTIAAGLAAAFGAPFAAILAPIEFGIGGRTISSVICAFSAFLASRFLSGLLGLPKFEVAGSLYDVSVTSWQAWLALGLTAIAGGLGGVVLGLFVDYFGRSLRAVAISLGGDGWRRIALGSILLAAIFAIYAPTSLVSHTTLQDLFWGRIALADSGILFFSKAFAFALVLSAFGTAGIFWPLLTLGGLFGFVFSQGVLHFIFPELGSFAPLAALAGGAAFWGSLLGAPVTGAVLACEITDSYKFLLPCLVAGLLAREVAHRMGAHTLFERDLRVRGFWLSEGRLTSILASLKVADAMVTDFECADEHEPVAQARERLLRAAHPFLPVIRSDGSYTGLLTIDMVYEGLAGRAEAGGSPLDQLLEVKDLLYRSGFRTSQVRKDDPLTVTSGLFHDVPCVPVVGDDGKMQGLLYTQNVRMVYEREVARRSLRTPV
jgi:H+/Cl- antiporter ClcA